MKNEVSNNYYSILLSYEVPYNVLDSQDPNVVSSREELLGRLKNVLSEKYETFSIKLTIFQLKDTLNYLVTYQAFFRSTEGLPMDEYVQARNLKENAEKELEDFFNSVDCDYKQLNIKTLI